MVLLGPRGGPGDTGSSGPMGNTGSTGSTGATGSSCLCFFFKPIVWIIVVADANARDILMLVNIHVLLDIRCMDYNSS